MVYDAMPMPSPPPASGASGSATGAAGSTSTPSHNNSNNNPTFAPPPGTTPPTARGASRDRRFGLPSFGRRREQEVATTTATTDLHTPPLQQQQQHHPPHPQHVRHASASHHAHPPPPPPLQIVSAVPLPPPPPPPPPPMATTTTDAAFPGIPPASRRAVSTGAIGTPTSARSRSASQVRWGPGMPLPPPPPGPPPPSTGGPGSRSQSLTRGGGSGGSSSSVPMLSPPTRRPPPAGVTVLGPVPPTPADWVEREERGEREEREERQERQEAGWGEDTVQPAADSAPSTPPQDTPDSSVLSSGSESTTATANEPPGSAGGSGSLFRTGAVRGEKTLRERRNESRTRATTTTTPTTTATTAIATTPAAAATTPVASPRRPQALSDILIPSPHTVGSMLQRRASRRGGGPTTPGGTPGVRTPAPAPAPAPHTPFTRDTAVRQTAEQFRDGTLARLQTFAAREAAAATDADRVRLFAAFVVGESRIRRERYAAAIGAMGSDLLDLTRDLFRPMEGVPRTPATPATATATATVNSTATSTGTGNGTATSTSTGNGTATSTSTATTTATPVSASSAFSDRTTAPNTPLSPPTSAPASGGRPLSSSNYYMPSLSPILSMSVASEHPSGKGKFRTEDDDDNDDNNNDNDEDDDDELNSRGRAPSRWWEASDHGNDRTTDRGRLERSRRESKYMGVTAAAAAVEESGSGSGSHDYSAYGPDEYPPEKGGGGRGEMAATPLTAEYLRMDGADAARTPQASAQHFGRLGQMVSASASAPGTPGVGVATGVATGVDGCPAPPPLDVSRLVTLPPPYPRHHPAVNNSHPELAATRAAVRRLADLAAADAVRAAFVRARRAAAAAEQQQAAAAQTALRARLQDAIGAGTMGYAAAAAEEAAFAAAAAAERQAAAKAEFAAFQREVVAPVHALYTERLAEVGGLYDGVVARLAGATATADPNRPQEAGDEQPELLETLTLLKWVFDAREALHRAVYDILTERNDRYREMVLAPYRGDGPPSSKLDAAVAFFDTDAAARARAEAAAAAARAAAFRAVAEDTVARGAESQLSAFWDIAPLLTTLLEQIPETAFPTAFAVHVPPAELAETPSYAAHPLQYLFGLLLHAEKSTHQFIESQTHLFCLLHEIQELALAADARAADQPAVDPDAARRLTAALHDKVRVVQDQWRAGLGDAIARVKERVGGWLLETGGWDESLEEGGVGSL